jgi:hypothetical protein
VSISASHFHAAIRALPLSNDSMKVLRPLIRLDGVSLDPCSSETSGARPGNTIGLREGGTRPKRISFGSRSSRKKHRRRPLQGLQPDV